eukprot:TRINITY_DN3835_c0_g1_i2.p1 TRINITY_DN3835_c0_g1~~TRINITY_DN3835_c0_g1_i2.p1  ORF type:complete len:224 (-),score=35.60 TRINITY_DN3835_c0_g1_i2:305-976(-)
MNRPFRSFSKPYSSVRDFSDCETDMASKSVFSKARSFAAELKISKAALLKAKLCTPDMKAREEMIKARSTPLKVVTWKKRLEARRREMPLEESKKPDWRELIGIKPKSKPLKEMDWREKLQYYKTELAKGTRGYFHKGVWKPLSLSARRRAHLRRQVLLAGEDWTFDRPRKPMKNKMKGHKRDRISAERRARTAELMEKMPQMLLEYKKRRWLKKMKAEEAAK